MDDTVDVDAQRRRLRALLLVCVIGWSIFAIQYAAQGRWQTVALDVTVAAGLAVLYTLCAGADSRRLDLLAHATLVLSVGGLSVAAATSGGPSSLAIWYLALLPLLAAYQIGARAAAAWTGVSVVAMVSVAALPSVVAITPEFVPDATEMNLGRAVLAGVVLAFAVAQRRAADSHVAALRVREATIRDYADERTLQAGALADARDQALAGEQAKSAFLATMSHEIRTPLVGVLGMAELLENTKLDPAQRDMVATIRRSGQGLMGVVADILDFSRLEAGEIDLKDETVNLPVFVHETLRPLQSRAESKGLRFCVAVDPNVPERMLGDPMRLGQVLTKVVANAIKFTDRGEVRVRLSRPSEARVSLLVSDTGVGVAAGEEDRIFEPFVQADPSMSRRFGGSGLGLSICRDLVTKMGGEIAVQRSNRAGSVFAVTLPYRAVQAVQAVQAAAAPSKPRRARPRPAAPVGMASKVLVAEDHAPNRQLVCSMLEHLGYAPIAVEDGAKAIAAAQKNAFDVIFMDLQMPEVDGYTATRRIREQGVGGPWIVALTANVLPENAAAAREAGVDDIVAKPFELTDIAAALRKAAKAHA